MAAIEKLIKGKEIDLEEIERRADKPQIQKVHNCFLLKNYVLQSCQLMIYYGWMFVHQHYKISAAELGISSLGDAITCRIASRDAL